MTWRIDPAHSRINFAVRHMMISTVRGEFREFEGAIDFNDADPEATTVHVTIEAGSIDTRAAERDAHLRSADFLDAENSPEITFKGRRVKLIDDEHATLVGDLTIRDETHEVAVDVSFHGLARSPWGKMSAGFTANATLRRKAWGLTWNQSLETGGVLVGDKVEVEIEVELIKENVEEAEAEAAAALDAAQ